MYDRKIKAQAIEFGALRDIRENNKALANLSRSADKQLPCVFSSYRECRDYIEKKYDTREKIKLLGAAISLDDSIHQKKKRLSRKIDYMRQQGDCLFITFTFRDDVLLSTTPDTRRQKVRRCLSRYNTLYVCNIDFGGDKGREHYHAIIQLSSVDTKELIDFFGYGAIKVSKVRSYSSTTRLSRYLSKLTNHALKDTNINYSLIYSRGFPAQMNNKNNDVVSAVPTANDEPLPF